MAKKKRLSSTDDVSDFDSVDAALDDNDLDGINDPVEFDLDLPEDATDSHLPNAAKRRLATKRRLDAYLERKWFRENGWDDEDDLFNDEFFEDLDIRVNRNN